MPKPKRTYRPRSAKDATIAARIANENHTSRTERSLDDISNTLMEAKDEDVPRSAAAAAAAAAAEDVPVEIEVSRRTRHATRSVGKRSKSQSQRKSWQCSQCTFVNPTRLLKKCQVCGYRSPTYSRGRKRRYDENMDGIDEVLRSDVEFKVANSRQHEEFRKKCASSLSSSSSSSSSNKSCGEITGSGESASGSNSLSGSVFCCDEESEARKRKEDSSVMKLGCGGSELSNRTTSKNIQMDEDKRVIGLDDRDCSFNDIEEIVDDATVNDAIINDDGDCKNDRSLRLRAWCDIGMTQADTGGSQSFYSQQSIQLPSIEKNRNSNENEKENEKEKSESKSEVSSSERRRYNIVHKEQIENKTSTYCSNHISSNVKTAKKELDNGIVQNLNITENDSFRSLSCFDDISKESSKSTMVITKHKCQSNIPIPTSNFMGGFTTAGSKSVIKVSDEALRRASEIYENREGDNSTSFRPRTSTAAKARVKLTPDAKKSLLGHLSSPQQFVSSSVSTFAGDFATANRESNGNITRNSIKERSGILRDSQLPLPSGFSPADTGPIRSANVKGRPLTLLEQIQSPLLSSSNHGTTVSKPSLNQVRDELNMGVSRMQERNASTNANLSGDFTTAGTGSAIVVSDDALKRANQILQENGGTFTRSSPLITSASDSATFGAGSTYLSTYAKKGASRAFQHKGSEASSSRSFSNVASSNSFVETGKGGVTSVPDNANERQSAILQQSHISFTSSSAGGIDSIIDVSHDAINRSSGTSPDEDGNTVKGASEISQQRERNVVSFHSSSACLFSNGVTTACTSPTTNTCDDASKRASMILYHKISNNVTSSSDVASSLDFTTESVKTDNSLKRASERLQPKGRNVDTSHSSSKSAFSASFTTAGTGATISVSDDAMKRASAVLQQADLRASEPHSMSNVSPSTSSGLTTVGPVPAININHNADKESSCILLKKGNSMTSSRLFSKFLSANGFTTAGTGSTISVSDDAIKRASVILQQKDTVTVTSFPLSDFEPKKAKGSVANVFDIETKGASDSPRLQGSKVTISDSYSKLISNEVGFTTAGTGSKINVFDDAIKRASAILQMKNSKSGRFPLSSDVVSLKGYTRCAAATKLSNTVSDNAVRSAYLNRQRKVPKVTASSSSSCLTTASKCSIVNASDQFKEGNDVPSNSFSVPSGDFSATDTDSTVKVADNVPKRVSGILQQKDIYNPTYLSSLDDISSSDFTPAKSGPIVDVSDTYVNRLNRPKVTASTSVIGFITAGTGSSISVSDDAMERAKVILQRKDSRSSMPPLLSDSASGRGYITDPKGSATNVTDHTRKNLSDILQPPASNLNAPSSNSKFISANGFSTAGTGSIIRVSDDAMERASMLLHEKEVVTSKCLSSRGVACFELNTVEQGSPMNAFNNTIKKDSGTLKRKQLKEYVSHSDSKYVSTTAGARSIFNVSDDSTNKTSRIFQQSQLLSTSTFASGFATAGKGSIISISEDAMKRASAVLQQKTNNVSAPKSPLTSADASGCEVIYRKCAPMDATKQTNSGILHQEQVAELSIHDEIASPQLKNPYQIERSPSKVPERNTTVLNETLSISGRSPMKELGSLKCSDVINPTSNRSKLPVGSKRFSISNPYKPSKMLRPSYVVESSSSQKDGEEFVSEEPLPSASDVLKKLDPPEERVTSICNSTPHHPTRARTGIVTRSVNAMKNPYTKTSSISTLEHFPNIDQTSVKKSAFNHELGSSGKSSIHPITPFMHVARTFGGKPLSAASLRKAEEVLGSSLNQEHLSITSRPMPPTKPRILNYDHVLGVTKEVEDVTSLSRKNLSLHRFSKIFDLKPLSIVDLSSGNASNSAFLSTISYHVNRGNAIDLRFGENGLPSHIDSGLTSDCDGDYGVQDFYFELRKEIKQEHRSLLSLNWIRNHYQWIVWKIASMERSFPSHFSRYLCKMNVHNQLRYRFERECIGAERSSLRLILNRDESAGRLITLCVCQILSTIEEDNCALSRLELTDGWYSIQAVLDARLTAFVETGKIFVGAKLVICDALLQNCEEGIDPLDKNYNPRDNSCSIRLKIHVNGTRLAPWHAKLGFCAQTRYLNISLKGIFPDGGNIPCTDVVVLRKYPILFYERMRYSSDGNASQMSECIGRTLTKSQEHAAQREYELSRQKEIEMSMEQIDNLCEEGIDEDAPRIWKQMLAATDPLEFYESQSIENRRVIQSWKDKRLRLIEESRRKSLDRAFNEKVIPIRESKPFLRLKVAALLSESSSNCSAKEATIIFWNVNESQLNLLEEGRHLRLRSMTVKNKVYGSELQLCNCTKTRIIKLSHNAKSAALSGFVKRTCLSFTKLHVHSKSFESTFDIDFIGIVLLSIIRRSARKIFNLVYFSDESGLIIRLERDDCHGFSDSGQWKLSRKTSEGCVFTICDVEIMPFDHFEGCAVMKWTPKSSITSNCKLREESIKNSFDVDVNLKGRLRTMLLAGVSRGIIIPNSLEVFVGYLVGVNLVNNLQSIALLIDCGNQNKHILCPNEKIIELITLICQSEGHLSSLLSNVDRLWRLDGEDKSLFRDIESAFLSSGILLHFHVQKLDSAHQGSEYSLMNVKKANTRALANLLAASMKEK